MNLNIQDLALPTHILLALRGDIKASNDIAPQTHTNALQTINNESLMVNLQSNVESVINDFDYAYEVTTLDDITSLEVVE